MRKQTIAPFLITLRVANRSAWTDVSVPSGSVSVIQFGSQGKSVSGNSAVLDERLDEAPGEARVEPGVGIETIDFRRDH